MRVVQVLCSLTSICSLATAAAENPWQKLARLKAQHQQFGTPTVTSRGVHPRAPVTSSPFYNNRSAKFVVDGKNIPQVNFDIGESYAGLLPVSNKTGETRQLFFWFFPAVSGATNGNGTLKEIGAWFNGGPGCSSLSGLLTENGPFLWQAGTIAPTVNPYAWNRLTNYVWVEQPVGVGYSTGEPNISNELELAEQFSGFWKNFMDTFQLQGSDIYLTGESYAGFYVPYIANNFLNKKDDQYFKLKGIAINDPLIGNEDLQEEIPIPAYTEYWKNVLALDSRQMANIRQQASQCGAADYYNEYFTFPPKPKPWAKPPNKCRLLEQMYAYSSEVNSCFNIYHIFDTCPFVYSHLGIVNDGDYSPPGAEVYFDRRDVKKALNVPHRNKWYQCTPKDVFINNKDTSPGPAIDGTLQNVIERTNNVIVGSGALDALLPTNGTLFVLQNMTWNGGQGFSKFPSEPFTIPDHDEPNGGALGQTGTIGVWRKERGLTFYDIQLAGHEVPGYSLAGGYRSLELLLGRVSSLSSDAKFTGAGPPPPSHSS